MLADTVSVRPLSPTCGLEVEGLDLSRLGESEIEWLRSAVAENGVVAVRGQDLSPEQHIAFARQWGEIDYNRFFPIDGRYPEIALVQKEENQKVNIGGGWHTDHSYDAEPAMGSILLARELPPSGGDTLFASMYAAYDSLSDGLKATLETMRAVHTADHIYGHDGAYAKTDIASIFRGHDEQTLAVHPVIITHPTSGRKALYVNPSFTTRFDGWTREESLPLLQYLYAQAIAQDNVCTLQWKPGSVAIWDNRASWHFAKNDYHGHRRVMHRITIAGCALS
jgi:taurine dioxygenase